MESQSGYEKAQEAIGFIGSLTDKERRAIEKHAERASATEDVISEISDTVGATKACGECGGMCCFPDVQDFLDVSDYVYTFLKIPEDTRIKVLDALEKSGKGDVYCALVEDGGCMLPGDARPYICKSFNCVRTSHKMNEAQIFIDILERRFKDFKSSLKRIKGFVET